MNEVYIGIDPGGTTGVAAFDAIEKRVIWATNIENDIGSLVQLIHDINQEYGTIAIVLEDYVGGGPRDKWSKHTLKLIGFIEHYSTWQQWKQYTQAPNCRYAYLEDAQDAFKKYVKAHGNLLDKQWKTKKYTRHMIDALAHAMSKMDEDSLDGKRQGN